MKKYIAPAANIINVQAENLMAMSSLNEKEGQNFQFSNKMDESDWEDEE